MPRAVWKGFLKISELSCQAGLYTAASTSDRIAFHTLNRATHNRVKRMYVDIESGEPVETENQVKGYEVSQNDYIILKPEEVKAAVPESDKTLNIERFVALDDVDDVFFDKPYYLTPNDAHAESIFSLIREGLRGRNAAALAKAVLFRKMRTVLIEPIGLGMLATTLSFDYQVRSADEAFDEIPDLKIDSEMLKLATHIIDTKAGTFDPTSFVDRYDDALAELVQAKLEGKPITIRKKAEPGKVVNLMDALRKSAAAAKKTAKSDTARRKTG